MNLRAYIMDGKWAKVRKVVAQNPELLSTRVYAENTVLHAAAMNAQEKILLLALEHNPDLFALPGENNNTPLHILAKYHHHKLLRKCLPNVSEYIGLTNNYHETVLHLVDSNKLLIWILENVKNSPINTPDNESHTILTHAINNSKTINDKYMSRIKMLLRYAPDLDKPRPALVYAALKNRSHIVTLLLDAGANPNQMDDAYLTALLYSIHNQAYDTSEQLLDAGADINYAGPNGEFNPMRLSLNRKDSRMVELLLSHNYDLSAHDRDLNTVLHAALEAKLPSDIIRPLIKHSNLNISNTKGQTPLHLLARRNRWRQYVDVLQDKKLDPTIKNRSNATPLDLMSSEARQDFLVKFSISKSTESISSINLVSGEDAIIGTFNADTMHNAIYTLLMLQKYDTLGIPYQTYNPERAKTDSLRLQALSRHTSSESVVVDLVSAYTEYFYEISPYLIIWAGPNQYYVDSDLRFHLRPALESDKVRFIQLKLTVVTSPQSTHANIIIYDKKTGIMDRFEPYGVIPHMHQNELDDMIETIVGSHFSTSAVPIKYLRPSDYINGLSFQTISNDSSAHVKKLGDPNGYCLAWTYWYLEMRLQNPDIHPKDLIKNAMRNIIKLSNSPSHTVFIDFIRNYAANLDKQKTEYMLQANIPLDRVYNLILQPKDRELLREKMLQTFYELAS